MKKQDIKNMVWTVVLATLGTFLGMRFLGETRIEAGKIAAEGMVLATGAYILTYVALESINNRRNKMEK